MDEDERDGAVDESGTTPIPSSGAGRGSSRAGGAGIGMAGIPRANRDAMHIAQTLFPSTLCTAFVEVIGLLDDHAVSLDGTGVYEVAYQVRYFNGEWGSNTSGRLTILKILIRSMQGDACNICIRNPISPGLC